MGRRAPSAPRAGYKKIKSDNTKSRYSNGGKIEKKRKSKK